MLNDKITKLTFFISMVGHILFLGMPEELFNFHLFKIEKSKDTIVQMEIEKPLLLPKVKKIGNKKRLKESKKELKVSKPDEIILDDSKFESVQNIIEIINPDEEAMLRYQDIVKQGIQEKREYPYWAKNQGIEGVVCLKFTILSNGQTEDIKIVKSSGYKILDKSAVSTIKKANPFPPLPDELNTPCIQMEVSLVYTLVKK